MVDEPRIGRAIPATWGRRASRATSALQHDPHFSELAARLLTVAAREEEAACRGRSGALVHRLFSSGDEGAAQWALYAGRLEAATERGPLSIRDLQSFAAQAPGGASSTFRELVSILSEPDRETFAATALNLAERNLDRDAFPRLTQDLLGVASAHSRTRARAESLLTVLSGGGGFSAQFEMHAPHLLRELTSPVSLGSFAFAGLAARTASLAVLGRSGRVGLSTWLGSEGAAWAVEVPSLVLSRRFGAQLFTGGENLWDGRAIGHEILTAAGPFLFLRGASNLFEYAAPTLRRAFENSRGEISPFGQWAMGSARFGSEVSAMMAGNSLNAAWELGPELSPWNSFYQSVLAVGHMRLAGQLLDRAGAAPLSEALSLQRARLFSSLATSSSDSSPPWQSFIASLEIPGERWALASAGEGGVRRPFDVRQEVFMVGEGEGGSGGNRPGGGDSPPPGGPKVPPTRMALLRELLRGSLENYTQETGHQETRLGRAATRLKELLERMGDRPDLAQDETFARALTEARAALSEAQQNDSTVGRSWQTLKALLRSYSDSTTDPAAKAEIQTQLENVERDHAQMAEEARELSRLEKILRAVGKFGSTESLQTRLRVVGTRLNALFRGKLQWTIPGTRRAAAESRLQEHLHGSLLGLAAKGNGTESPLAQALRGESGRVGENLDIELEYLHQALLTTMLRRFQQDGLEQAIHDLVVLHRVPERSAAAMALAADTLLSLYHPDTESHDLRVRLKAHPASRSLEDHFRDLNSLLDDDISIVDGLSALAQDATASDYLVTGLYVLLRSHEDPAALREGIGEALKAGVPGFHPSIPLSLFGARYGRELMPRELLPPQAQLDQFLHQVLRVEGEGK